jgi:hypothetical protein
MGVAFQPDYCLLASQPGPSTSAPAKALLSAEVGYSGSDSLTRLVGGFQDKTPEVK